MTQDPFEGLEAWGREAERRARRGHLLARLRTAFSRARRRPTPRPARVRRNRWGLGIGVVLAVAGVVVGLDVLAGRGHSLVGVDGKPAASHPAGIFATTTARAKGQGPFIGTPAEHYAVAEAGIEVPAATALNGFDAQTVAGDLQQVRRALIAGRLDEAMLVRHDPATFLGLFAPTERARIQPWFADRRLGGIATWYAPEAHPATERPRVSGRMTYRLGTPQDGRPVLEVITNYVWAYGFADDEVVVKHDENTWQFYADPDLRDEDRGMWAGDSSSYTSNMDCDLVAKGLLSPPVALRGNPHHSYDPVSLYDPDHPLEIGNDCA